MAKEGKMVKPDMPWLPCEDDKAAAVCCRRRSAGGKTPSITDCIIRHLLIQWNPINNTPSKTPPKQGTLEKKGKTEEKATRRSISLTESFASTLVESLNSRRSELLILAARHINFFRACGVSVLPPKQIPNIRIITFT